MKIAFVSQPIDTLLPPFQNSVGACTYGSACSLAALGDDVTAYGVQWKDKHEWDVSRNGVKFRFLPCQPADSIGFKLRTKASKFVPIWSPISTSRWLYPGYGLRVAKSLARERFDVIHIQHCTQYVSMIRQMNPQSKIVLHLHAEWFSQSKPAKLADRLKGLDLLTGVSDHVINRTKAQLPAFAVHAETTYNGIDANEFAMDRPGGPAAKRKVKRILYAGSVSPHKGVHVLLDAFKIVTAQYPDARLDIVGPHGAYPLEETIDRTDVALLHELEPFYPKGFLSVVKSKLSGSAYGSDNYLPYLQSKITGEIASKVSFLGMIPRPELVQNYYDCDLFVFPPIWDEGYGIPPVEAMAAGAPVVATRSGALVETVQHERTGLLVKKNDPQSLAQSMLDLLTNDELSTRMGKAGRDRARAYFTWDRVAQRMHSRYGELLAPGVEAESQVDVKRA